MKVCSTETAKSSMSLAVWLLDEGFEPVLRSLSRNFADMLDHRAWTTCWSSRSCGELSRTDLSMARPTKRLVSSLVLRSW